MSIANQPDKFRKSPNQSPSLLVRLSDSPFLYPFLWALYPPLAILAANIGEVPAASAVRALLISLVVAALLFALTGLVLRDFTEAALIVTGVLILFYSYGHVYRAIKPWVIGGFPIGRHRYLLVVWGAMLLIWVWWVLRRMRSPILANRVFNLMGIVLLAFPVFTLSTTALSNAGRNHGQTPRVENGEPVSGESQPDIYYIILDGYGRQDVLAELYDYDNSDFIDALKGMGFYVADQSRSNYIRTLLSLSSSLNMTSVQELSEQQGVSPLSNDTLSALIENSQVRKFLQERGYHFVAFDSGFNKTTFRDADVFLSPESEPGFSPAGINPYEGILLETTLMRSLVDLDSSESGLAATINTRGLYDQHRANIIWTLDHLGEAAKLDGNNFVFAHIVAPHPPFVFGPQGQSLYPNNAYSLSDGSSFEGSPEEYIHGYRDQMNYLNQLVIPTVEAILENSNSPPVIIIQGDHGPGAYLSWDSVAETNLEERTSILNAYYLPDQSYDNFYETVTPENSFRLVFNQLFDAQLPLLPDETYYSNHSHPDEFIPVDNQSPLSMMIPNRRGN